MRNDDWRHTRYGRLQQLDRNDPAAVIGDPYRGNIILQVCPTREQLTRPDRHPKLFQRRRKPGSLALRKEDREGDPLPVGFDPLGHH